MLLHFLGAYLTEHESTTIACFRSNGWTFLEHSVESLVYFWQIRTHHSCADSTSLAAGQTAGPVQTSSNNFQCFATQ